MYRFGMQCQVVYLGDLLDTDQCGLCVCAKGYWTHTSNAFDISMDYGALNNTNLFICSLICGAVCVNIIIPLAT